LDRDLGVQIDRQASLLFAISDLGEGLVITEGGRYVASNDAYVKLTGYSREELQAFPTLIDLAPAEEREKLAADLDKRFAGEGAPVRYEAGIITKDGRRIQVEVAIHRISAEGEQRLLALVSDITERHRAEQAERVSEMRFRTLFEQAQAGMSFAGLDGKIMSVNPAYCELLGYTADELKSLSVYDVTIPEDVDATKEAQRRMMAGGAAGARFLKRGLPQGGGPPWGAVAARL